MKNLPWPVCQIIAQDGKRLPLQRKRWPKTLCNKKNDFYENVIIHSKTRVGVTMKNSSLVDTLSRNNRSKRKATGITKDKKDEPSLVGNNTYIGPPAQPRAGTKCSLVYLRLRTLKASPWNSPPKFLYLITPQVFRSQRPVLSNKCKPYS